MSTTAEQILTLFNQRKADEGPWATRARDIRDLYGGDVVVPLPEIERVEKPAVANLTKLGLDQMGARVASVLPDVIFPMRNPGIQTQQTRSKEKRRAVLGWWDTNRMGLKMYRRGRWLLAYAKAPVAVRPDFVTGIPRWELKDPLATFPGTKADRESPCVPDNISAVKRSYDWLQKRYPDQVGRLAKPNECTRDELFDVLEYEDADELVVVVVGKNPDSWGITSGAAVLELERMPNRAERCCVFVPTTISLDEPRGQFDGMVGLHQMQARLMALETIAVERGIFPDEWLVGDAQGSTPEIIQVADGRRGQVGMVRGGQLRQVQDNPGYQTFPTIDRMERAQRLNGGIPADFGGESASNVRTGRRGENILSATIDYTLQEAQQIFASSLEEENKAAIAVARAYLDGPQSFYVSWKGAEGYVDYTATELFDSDQNVVSYAQAGSDINGLVISGMQRVGGGTMSRHSFMRMDPLVADADFEEDQIVAEGLQQALLSSIQQMTAGGQIPPADVARIMELVRSDKMDLAAAVLKAQEEAQERQAAQVEATAPEAQPGLAAPGAGAESAIIPDEPVGPSLQNLSSLLTSLRRPQMQLESEQGPQEVAV